MNKKFLSAILFGAMLVTAIGTFVSCKDYDDDIENLQAQINNLATKDDMTAQISSLQSSLSSAASDASAALSDAQAAQTAAQQALADAQAAKTAAESAGDDAGVAKAEAEAATATANEAKAAADAAAAAADLEAITTLQEQLAELQTKVDAVSESNTAAMDALREELLAAIAEVEKVAGANASDVITSIEFVRSYTSTDPQSLAMEYTIAVEQDNVFEEGIDKYITFKAGDLYQVPASFLVRVSPTNATLTADMIHFVNSQGDNLDDLVKVTDVEPSTTLLHGEAITKAATSETGLWEVTAQLVDQTTQKDFEAATITTISKVDYPVLFAVQVNNTIDADSTRYVTSTYDLTMSWADYEPYSELYFFVDDTPVTEINNRYENNGAGTNPSLPYTTDEITYVEETWTDSTDKVPTPATEMDTKTPNVQQDTEDNRATLDLYPAVQGVPITISLTDSKEDEKVVKPGIRALYVTLDYQENAIESQPSEWNAWNSYSYTGLNTVVEGTTTTITINAANGVINDIIGFRVYAVNYDGTLVDPDGKAFYVSVGSAAINWDTHATTITPSCDEVFDTESTSAAVSMSKLSDIAKVTWVTDAIDGDTDIFTAHFYNGKTEVFNTTDNLSDAMTADLSKITSVTTTINIKDWTKYSDDKAYTGTLTFYDATGHVLATITVTMTKTLPSGMPEGFSAKTAQIVNGVYYCYMIPDNTEAEEEGNAATVGTMVMSEVFNYGEEHDHYSFSFANADYDSSNKLTANEFDSEDGELDVPYDLVDSKTLHATTVTYTYGNLSSNSKSNPVVGTYTFNTIFECVYDDSNNTYSWDWATLEQLGLTDKDELPYSTELTYGVDYLSGDPDDNDDKTVYFEEDDFAAYIYGTSKWDKIYSMLLSDNESLYITDATVTSDGNGVAEYFEVEVEDGAITGFKAVTKSSTTNPTAPVASTLTITMNDIYGHTITIKFPMTVNRRAD